MAGLRGLDRLAGRVCGAIVAKEIEVISVDHYSGKAERRREGEIASNARDVLHERWLLCHRAAAARARTERDARASNKGRQQGGAKRGVGWRSARRHGNTHR